MLSLAAHILDIVENSVRASATLIEILIAEDTNHDCLTLEIIDNGHGMDEITLHKVRDPFYTTKTVRRVGLGLPLLAEASERSGGTLQMESRKNMGTRIKATFGLKHLDRQPLGDIVSTLIILIVANIHIDFLYKHKYNDRQFEIDTRDIRKEIGDIPINHPDIIKYIRGVIEEGLNEIGSES